MCRYVPVPSAGGGGGGGGEVRPEEGGPMGVNMGNTHAKCHVLSA